MGCGRWGGGVGLVVRARGAPRHGPPLPRCRSCRTLLSSAHSAADGQHPWLPTPLPDLMASCRFSKNKPVKRAVHVPCWDSFRWNPLRWRGIVLGRCARMLAARRAAYAHARRL